MCTPTPASNERRAALFELVAVNEEARAVVRLNPAFQFTDDALGLSSNYPSKTAGMLATFGTHPNNDIRLPIGPDLDCNSNVNGPPRDGGSKSRKNFQNYGAFHFYFYLHPASGELILREYSRRSVSVELADASREEGDLYQLHGTPPRQRVIPRTSRTIYITFGDKTVFNLVWHRLAIEEHAPWIQKVLVKQAQRLAVTDVMFTEPDEPSVLVKSPILATRSERQLRSRFTPAIPATPSKSCHKYRKLGSGTFGVVWKVVDLASGRLWALKEIRTEARDDRWKDAFKKEVEIMWRLKHENIAHFESFQDFRLGGTFQLFFRLYEGSLRQLLPAHSCLEPPSVPHAWIPQLISQMLDALDFLHGQGVVHRDIKPDNILFDHAKGDDQLSFYLADFGLSVSELDVTSACPAGTLPYMAPEVALDRKTSSASDMWSFAIMLGRVLGFWCEAERAMDALAWMDKLAALGGGAVVYDEPAYLAAPKCIQRRWYHRITYLAEAGCLPSMFARMLVEEGHRAIPSYCKAVAIHAFINRPQQPRHIVAEDHATGGLVWRLSARIPDDMSIEIRRRIY